MALPRRQSAWVWLEDRTALLVVLGAIVLVANLWYDFRHRIAVLIDGIVIAILAVWGSSNCFLTLRSTE